MKFILIGLTLYQFAFSENDFLQNINTRRAEFAEEYQIANMNYLNYDEDLEKIIEEEFENNDGCFNESLEIEQNGIKIYLNYELDNELLVAGQTRVAGWENECGSGWVSSFAVDVPSIAPGSECSEGREADSQGLCQVMDSAENSRKTKNAEENDMAEKVIQLVGKIIGDFDEYMTRERERKEQEDREMLKELGVFLVTKAMEQFRENEHKHSGYKSSEIGNHGRFLEKQNQENDDEEKEGEGCITLKPGNYVC